MSVTSTLSKFYRSNFKTTLTASKDLNIHSRDSYFLKPNILCATLIFILTTLYLLSFWLTPFGPNQTDFTDRLATPSLLHWFGTDHLGRDIATRISYGALWSVGLAFLIASSGAVIGIVIGLTCGFLAQYSRSVPGNLKTLIPTRFIDQWMMRITDSFFAFPELVAAVAISGLLGASTTNMVLALTLLSWMKYCRLVRSLTLEISQEDFIVQARLNRLPIWYILWRHILPNLRLQVFVLWTNSWSRTILAISGLSFLGFGVQPPNAEWGAMLLDGKAYFQTAPHIMIFPGLAILITVLIINIYGDYVHDKLQQPDNSSANL